ncbi:hypothetical protein GALL_419250 [mine drainage metagenome]|uniref:Uncharacterized protein n=1 Tax=mine drainage metagenome TaxID=410659 RepID=A0A1J5Q8Q8_9ZZZZ
MTTVAGDTLDIAHHADQGVLTILLVWKRNQPAKPQP